MASNSMLFPDEVGDEKSPASKNSIDKNPSPAQREELDNPSAEDKTNKNPSSDGTALLQTQQSPTQARRLSREWDASKVPPSQFQRPKGSIYATPSTRDGHVERADRDHKYWDKMKEKGWLPGSDKK
ncbi:hypothetical protein P171DRAFT_426200 [Karstenula rhodostoma CBS 690.94]|uniref:Uncharacterized protein n=1 Tax=Karstenula rhodostoma CBS 690.94 TaxID=1392251 RepID=A0A9P4PWX2_9PLEO|nr:hypothetical protein P171DRAFT_426200 [Karstenula rhodostoma CBS 690.94]